MGFLSWIVMGALAGWIASLIAGTNRQQGCLIDIIVGIVGAFIGGFAYTSLTGQSFNAGFNLTSLLISVAGAVILLFILKAIQGRR
ncbi:MAG: Transglycosylase-associated protein [uncultured Truepera sp.]|uniref:Transglycosylase-associated protein n=1 Tax=uncultured Truepera sp. TaxID=543023 RepID=A0A6J4VC26_9DEIN|nr:MAG: Transglycosylase-associated protein [uncultured Truepera sp.]